jgi:NAD(P)-dependent dehydrogenase (short-subunit alcohol dehydrogenase family)
MRSKGETAVITGSASGIWYQMATLLAEQAAPCSLLDFLDQKGVEGVWQIQGVGSRALYVHAEVPVPERQWGEWLPRIERVRRNLGR